MSKNIVENKWNPVKLGGSRRGAPTEGYKISSYSISSAWYNKTIANDGTRLTRLRNYQQADESSVEISRALDILAEDISSCNADDDEVFKMVFDDEDRVKKSTITLCNEVLKMWERRTDFKGQLYDRVRNTIKFGATFYKKNVDGSLTELPTERMVGYILSHENDDDITHYIYDKSIQRLDECGRTIGNSQHQQNNKDNIEPISVDDLVILKIGNTPFGESLIQGVYGVWKVMKMVEDSVVIYRVTRSYERRVYYIDVGNLQGPKREAAIERQRVRLQQKNSNRSGDLTTEYDPHSMGEDIFIPTNSTGKGSRVDTLQSGMNLGELADLEWFRKKLAAGLRIPSSMIDTQEQGQQNQHTDMRIGQIYQIEMRYMGHVKRLKRGITPALHNNLVEFAHKRQVTIPENCSLVISDSMSFVKYKEIELQQSLLNVMNSSLQLTSISKRYALQKYMQMDHQELSENETSKLREMGIDEKVIKKLPQNVIENIVYGDGKLGSEYGIEAGEDESGGRGW